MRISAIQMNVRTGDVQENIEAALEGIEGAASDGARVAVLPELWTAGYVWLAGADYTGPREALEVAESFADSSALFAMREAARQYEMWLVAGSLPELHADRVYNTSVVIDPAGSIVHRYRKIHLIHLMKEPDHLAPGQACDTLAIDEITAGIVICYDLRFPELMRQLALRGAEMIIVPAQWPEPRIDHWVTLLRARAIENQCFVVGANRVGAGGGSKFPGASMIVGPTGKILARGGEEPCVLSANLEMDRLREIRQFLPVFRDRRPEAYRVDR